MKGKERTLGEGIFFQCSFERKQKKSIWSLWVGAVRKEVAEMWVRNKMEPAQRALL